MYTNEKNENVGKLTIKENRISFNGKCAAGAKLLFSELSKIWEDEIKEIQANVKKAAQKNNEKQLKASLKEIENSEKAYIAENEKLKEVNSQHETTIANIDVISRENTRLENKLQEKDNVLQGRVLEINTLYDTIEKSRLANEQAKTVIEEMQGIIVKRDETISALELDKKEKAKSGKTKNDK